MNVNGTGNSTNTTASPGSSKLQLKTDDFIKMMITQLQNQDPLEPAKNEQLLAQMSQISQLESSTQLTSSLKTMVSQFNLSSASSMIGKMVKGKDAAGADIQGIVTSVKVEDGVPSLELDNGKKIGIDNITNILSASTVGQSTAASN